MPEGIRPTQNIARKIVFDILDHDLEDMSFLDLFAGSGSMAFEALSRGAQRVVMIEKEKKCVNVIQKNIEILNISQLIDRKQTYGVIHKDAYASIKLFTKENLKFDIIFVDPPYGRNLAKKALNHLLEHDILQPNCMVIVQREKSETLPDYSGRFLLYKERKLGSTILTVLTLNS